MIHMKPFKVFVLAIVALCLATFTTQAQVYRKSLATSNSVSLTVSASNLVNSTQVTISPRGNGISFAPFFATTNSGTENVGFQLGLSVDGTNYNNANNLWFVTQLNGTAGVRTFTNFPATAVANAAKIKLLQVTNSHGSTVFLTNAYFGQVFDR